MNADELRALQAPLKTRYREDPDSARVTMRARARVGQDAPTCRVETGLGQVQAGLHPAAGGDGSAACSGDMLLEALASCAGVTLKAVATAMGVPLDSAVVHAEGELDFRGTLGVSKDVPVGFGAIRLTFELASSAPAEQLAKLVQLAERYCVVLQTLRTPPAIAVEIKR
jgi:uncharacterized OsmC-like protein